jgi:hypothetical protein
MTLSGERVHRRNLRLVAALVAVLASVLTDGALLGDSLAAGASPAGLSACTATAGVLVAVDFSHWGGPVDLGCASGRQADGLDAMHDAGFLTAGDEAAGDAFVCRIGVASKGDGSERPTPAEDPCVSTPPASAYWAFWIADAGQGAWSYSQSGADSYQPAPGSIEGWGFGSGGAPSVTPAQLRAEAAPPPTTSVPSTSSAPTTVPDTTTPTTIAGGTTLPSIAPPTTVGGSKGHEPSAPTTTSPDTTSTTTRLTHIVAVGSGAGTSPGGSAGTPTGALITVALLTILAASGGAVAWRRWRAG